MDTHTHKIHKIHTQKGLVSSFVVKNEKLLRLFRLDLRQIYKI